MATGVDVSRRLCRPKARRSIAKPSGGGGGLLEPAWARGDLNTPVASLELSAYWARDRLWLFDRRTIARVRANDGVTEHLDSVEATGVIAHGGGTVTEEGLIVGTGGDPSAVGTLVALDPETRAIAWKAASPNGWQPASSNGAVLAAGYAGLDDARIDALSVWAVRGDSGVSLWRRALELHGRTAQLVTPGDGCAYAVVEESLPGSMHAIACDVRALDVGTGEQRWSYRVRITEAREPCGAAADADMLVLAAPDGALHVLDAASGSLRVRAPVDGWLSDFYQGFGMLVRAPMAYVLTGSPDDLHGRAPAQRALVAIDLDDATRARWKHAGPLSMHTPPVADDERIYVHTDGGELRALALLDGTLEWSWYAGVGGPTAMLVPPEAPRWLIVAGAGGRLGGTMGFDLRAPPRGSQVRTRIAGRILQGRDAFDPGGIPVQVADEIVRTDAGGRFSAEVRGEGYALVEAMDSLVKPRAPMEDPCPTSSAVRVALDGKMHADVRIRIEFPECGED
jgi:outer membrane protein assembly factor BamB